MGMDGGGASMGGACDCTPLPLAVEGGCKIQQHRSTLVFSVYSDLKESTVRKAVLRASKLSTLTELLSSTLIKVNIFYICNVCKMIQSNVLIHCTGCYINYVY